MKSKIYLIGYTIGLLALGLIIHGLVMLVILHEPYMAKSPHILVIYYSEDWTPGEILREVYRAEEKLKHAKK